MNALPHPAEEPVDEPQSGSPHDWSGYRPPTGSLVEPKKSVAHTWFTPLWTDKHGQASTYAWRFTCPFCGEERQDDDYRETYAMAYRHLDLCEWRDAAGLGPGRF